jgi:hypothetical protein
MRFMTLRFVLLLEPAASKISIDATAASCGRQREWRVGGER